MRCRENCHIVVGSCEATAGTDAARAGTERAEVNARTGKITALHTEKPGRRRTRIREIPERGAAAVWPDPQDRMAGHQPA